MLIELTLMSYPTFLENHTRRKTLNSHLITMDKQTKNGMSVRNELQRKEQESLSKRISLLISIQRSSNRKMMRRREPMTGEPKADLTTMNSIG